MVKIQRSVPSLPATKAPSAKGNIIYSWTSGFHFFPPPRELKLLAPTYWKCSPSTRSFGISLEPARNAGYQTPLQPSWIRIWNVTRSSGESCSPYSWEAQLSSSWNGRIPDFWWSHNIITKFLLNVMKFPNNYIQPTLSRICLKGISEKWD